MNSYAWVMYAGIAVWLGLGLYLCLLCRRQNALSRRISRLAALMEAPLPERTPAEQTLPEPKR